MFAVVFQRTSCGLDLELEGKHHSLVRDRSKDSVNRLLFEEKKEIIQSSRDPLDAHSRLFLNFEWEKAKELRMV
ncbi:hypothetical protein FACS1894182_10000 [Bacteroidia bacterium]|nr:hypothetical protein FACS1894182_10000 [Bacteroidia bacterium]